MGIITSILPLRKVKCNEMTWQWLRARLVASKSRACVSRVCATFTRLYWSLKPARIVLNACSVLTLEELNFTDEQLDPCVYKLVRFIAMVRCKIWNIVVMVAVHKEWYLPMF